MLKVNASARIEGLHLAAMNFKGEGKPLPRFSQKDLDDMQRPLRFVPSEVDPLVRPFMWRQEKFTRKFLKDSDRIFSSDILLAYDWYCDFFRSFFALRRLGVTADDIGFPKDRWEDYLSGEWSCPEEIQTIINVASEMDTKESFLFMYKKLVRAFSVKQNLGFIPDYWEAYHPLSEGFQKAIDEDPACGQKEEPEGPKFVTCCFTVNKEVGEWLKAKGSMSQFVKNLIDEERKNEG